MYAGRETADSVRQFKQVLNRAVPDWTLATVLDRLEARFPRAQTTVEELYLTPTQLGELSAAGMGIGAHTVTHPVLSELPVAAQRWEIATSRRQLTACLDAPVELFAYPYGTETTYNEQTKRILSDVGCRAAFTTISGDVRSRHLMDSPLELRRRDCNEFPHGGATFDLS